MGLRVNYHAIFMTIYLLALCGGWKFIFQDPEFKTKIKLKRGDRALFLFMSVFPLFWVLYANFAAGLFAAIAFPYLQLSSLTDKKTQLVYITPMWVILGLAVTCESIAYGHFSFYSVFMFLFIYIIGATGMFGMGDVPMSFIPGAAFYLQCSDQGFLNAMLFECFFMLISQFLFWLKNMADGNMATFFQLKVKKALGPSLLIGAYFTYGIYVIGGFGGILC